MPYDYQDAVLKPYFRAKRSQSVCPRFYDSPRLYPLHLAALHVFHLNPHVPYLKLLSHSAIVVFLFHGPQPQLMKSLMLLLSRPLYFVNHNSQPLELDFDHKLLAIASLHGHDLDELLVGHPLIFDYVHINHCVHPE